MVSATVRDGLNAYGIGEKLRALRLRKKMGLVELGKHTGLSAALLSKIERGRLFPTLPTLLRISLVFSVGLDYFFAGAREKPLIAVMRKEDRVQLPDEPGGSKEPAYRFESLDFGATERKFDTYLAEFLPASTTTKRVHTHPGVEFIYQFQGTLTVQISGTAYELKPGDSMYFDATLPHRYERTGARPCQAIIVTSR